MGLKEKIKSLPFLKKLALWLLRSEYRPRPRWWVRNLYNPFVHKKGKGALVSRNTRMDVFPYNKFVMGEWSTVENFSCVNNALGDVFIGSKSRVGLSNTVIGPVTIGNNVNIAQNVVMSGLNHGYEDISLPPREQPCSTAPIIIEDDCWIGANVVVTSGVIIGKHSVVAAGSVVTKSCASYSILAGNPARVIKVYDFIKKEWVRVSSENKTNTEQKKVG